MKLNMNLVNNDRTTKIVSVVLAVVFGVLVVSLVANAVTTISTNIVTDGNSTTTSATTTTSHFSLDFTGSTLSIGGSATTTINSAGNLLVSGSTTLQRFTFTSATSTTSNAATSTLEVGCIQTYATSTVTAIHLTFAIGQISTGTSQGGAQDTTASTTGTVLWRYGACPI